MIFNLFLICSISIVGYGLAILVQRKGIRTESTKIFIFLICSLVTWVVLTLFENPNIFSERAIKFLVQVDYTIAPLMAYLFLVFCLSFPQKVTDRASFKKILFFLPTLFFIILPSSGLVVKNVAVSGQVVNISGGRLYNLYAAYFFAYLALAFFYLILKYRKLKGLEKAQISYVITGFFLTSFFFVITNLLVPFIPSVARLSRLGLYSIFFFLGFTTYAILRYRLMDIRVIIRRGTIEMLTILTLIPFYIIPLFLVVPFVEKTILLIMGLSFFVLAFLILSPLRTFYQKLTNKYFFAELYQSEKVLREVAQKLTTVIELPQLLDLIADTILRAFQPEKIGIFILSPEERNLELKKSINLKKEDILIDYLATFKEPLVLPEIGAQFEREKDEKKKEKLRELKTKMEKMDITLSFPLLTKNILWGIIVLSKKSSQDFYSKEDISLLNSLTDQASIAVANARLYGQVKEKTDELEKFYKAMVGREVRMAELKKEIERLRVEKKEDTIE